MAFPQTHVDGEIWNGAAVTDLENRIAAAPFDGGTPSTPRRLQPRRGTAAAWTAANPVLAAGEWGYETDTGKARQGDGTSVWSALTSVATLDVSGRLPAGTLPNVGGDASGTLGALVVSTVQGGKTPVLVNPGKTLIQGQLQPVSPVLGRQARRITASQAYTSNAATPLTISTPDASGQVVEPAVEYIEGGWNGHSYWALVTGYTSGNAATENPSLYYSDDGQTFTPAPGVAFPIAGAPTGGYNDDPEIILGPDNKLHLFWVETITTAQNTCTVKWCTYDGTTVTTPTVILGSFDRTVEAPIAPVLYWDGAGSQWVMFYTDIVNVINAVNVANPYKMRTCAGTQPNGTWSTATVCTITGLPSTQTMWESHIAQRGEQLHMVTTTALFRGNTAVVMYFGVSNDKGLTWQMGLSALLRPSQSGWDNTTIYRGDIVPKDDGSGTLYELWYSGSNATPVWRMAYTTIKYDQAVGGYQDNLAIVRYGGVGRDGIPVNAKAVAIARLPIAPYVFGDSAVRANNAASPGSADSGQAYTVFAGTIGILSNAIYAAVSGNAKAGVVVAGAADGLYTAEIAAYEAGAGKQGWMMFRLSDTNNYYRFGFDNGVYKFDEVVAGGSNPGIIAGAPAPQVGDVLAARVRWQNIWLYLNGVLIYHIGQQTNLDANSGIGVQIVASTVIAFRNLTARALVGGQ